MRTKEINKVLALRRDFNNLNYGSVRKTKRNWNDELEVRGSGRGGTEPVLGAEAFA